jgi:hypothetical protein
LPFQSLGPLGQRPPFRCIEYRDILSLLEFGFMGLLLFDLPKWLLHRITAVALCLSELFCHFPGMRPGGDVSVPSTLNYVARLVTAAFAAMLVVPGVLLPASAKMSDDHTHGDGGWLRVAGHVHSVLSPAFFLRNGFMYASVICFRL